MKGEEQTKIKLANPYYWAGLVVFLLLALFSGVPVFWIAFWFLLFWALCSLFWLINLAGHMEIVVNSHPRETVRNSSANLELRVINESFLPFPYAEIQIEGLDEKKFSSENNGESLRTSPVNSPLQSWMENSGQDNQEIKEIVELDDNYPLGSWKVHYRLKCFRRGCHFIGPLRVKLYTLFGALAVEKSFSGSRSFVVYPRSFPFSGRYKVENMESHGTQRDILSNPFSHFNYTGSYDLRPFNPGDPFMLINWKVSARQGEIYVKQPEVTNQVDLVLGIEFSEVLYSSREEQDLALEKVLSLAAHLLLNHYRVGLFTYDGQQYYLPPGRGKRQFNLIRKLFTDLKPDCQESLLTYTFYNHRTARDRLIWVTPRLDQNYLDGLSSIRKPGQKLSLMITDEVPDLKFKKIPAHFYIWQLIFVNDRVTVKWVEPSWL